MQAWTRKPAHLHEVEPTHRHATEFRVRNVLLGLGGGALMKARLLRSATGGMERRGPDGDVSRCSGSAIGIVTARRGCNRFVQTVATTSLLTRDSLCIERGEL